jgi:hypothetical protein
MMTQLLKNKSIAILLWLFFFTVAKFYYFNIIGIKKFALVAVAMIIPLLFINNLKYLSLVYRNNKIFTISIGYMIVVWILRSNLETTYLYIITMVLSGFILESTRENYDRLVKYMTAILGFFSSMVIIQASLYILIPSLFDGGGNPVPESRSSIDTFPVFHPIQYLGFWASGRTIMVGLSLPRFSSFASEPSMLVPIFYIPGLIGLTYSGFIRKASILILIFTIILAHAGTIYLSLAAGGLLYIILYFSELTVRHRQLRKYGLLVVVILLGLQYFTLSASQVMGWLDSKVAIYSNYASILGSASHKSYVRLISSSEAMSIISALPFGSDQNALTATGLILDYGLMYGYLGIILCIFIYLAIILKYAALFFSSSNIVMKVVVALIAGTLVQSLLFNGYGWLSPSGIIISILLYKRVEFLNEESYKLSNQK